MIDPLDTRAAVAVMDPAASTVAGMAVSDTAPQNAQCPWDIFPSEPYYEHNYALLRDHDREITERVGAYFQSAGVTRGRGIDVGPGTNLSPSLAMLPFCQRISLWEYSAANIDWLKRNVNSYQPNWDQFWSVLQPWPAYAAIRDPRRALAAKAHVVNGNVFRLPEAHWDMGTMFFVACSISADIREFNEALRRFVFSLKTGAPFAAAFMEGSDGYEYAGIRYPAVKIDKADVEQALKSLTYDVNVVRIETTSPLRSGYEGMLLAVGRRGPADRKG